MSISDHILRLRTSGKLSQQEFAELFHVSQQSVQKWESGISVPDLGKLIRIAEYFRISLDELVLDRKPGQTETQPLQPDFSRRPVWESYTKDMMTEFQQSMEEGLDLEAYRDVFQAVSVLPETKEKHDLCDTLFHVVRKAPLRQDYPYREPSGLEEIRALRSPHPVSGTVPEKNILRGKIRGAWLGRICGCLLGKTVECIRTEELISFLKETENYPMHRYILSTDLTDEICSHYRFDFRSRKFADGQPYMPFDDDTNYTVMAQRIIEEYGRNFTSEDVADAWLRWQPKDSYCTAERVAFCNFIRGYLPPESAVYKNPYREWIGAQIRGDYFGYINPGDPETAAEMAFRDACISHVKNGIYGEMFAAAMIACAAVTDDMEEIVLGGLAQIPSTSRLYESVMQILNRYHGGASAEECFDMIHEAYDEHTAHGWCHTIPNAMIVVTSLLYGEKDYGKSICMAVQTGFDTDCNGATVGSVLGMVLGADRLDPVWTDPVHDTLETTLFGMNMVSVTQRAEMTLSHLEKNPDF